MRRCATTTSAAGVNPSTSSNASSPGQNDSLSTAQEKCAPTPDACPRQRQRQAEARDAGATAKLELHHLPARDSASGRNQAKPTEESARAAFTANQLDTHGETHGLR